MIDQFFQQEYLGDIFLNDIASLPMPVVNHSAFVPYTKTPFEAFRTEGHANLASSRNLNKRMIEFLRRSWTPACRAPERLRGFRHMMSERMRRERQKQCFTALHAMLPFGTKNDKNSIMMMAAKKIQELEKYKGELQRRNQELKADLVKFREGRDKETMIRVKVGNPTCHIDSMVEALKCLNNMGLGKKIRSIQSDFSGQELAAVLGIQSKIGAAEIEKTVHESLHLMK